MEVFFIKSYKRFTLTYYIKHDLIGGCETRRSEWFWLSEKVFPMTQAGKEKLEQELRTIKNG